MIGLSFFQGLDNVCTWDLLFFGSIGIVRTFLHVFNCYSSSLGLEHIKLRCLAFKSCNSRVFHCTCAILIVTVHEFLFVNLHLVEVSNVVVLCCYILVCQPLISLTVNFPRYLELLFEKIYGLPMHSHKSIAQPNLLACHHRRILQHPNVTIILQWFVCPYGLIILP